MTDPILPRRRLRHASDVAAARGGAVDPVNGIVVLGIAGALGPATAWASLPICGIAMGVVWVRCRAAEDPDRRARRREANRQRKAAKAADARRRPHPLTEAALECLMVFAVLIRSAAILSFCTGSTTFMLRVSWVTFRDRQAPSFLTGLLWIGLLTATVIAMRACVRDYAVDRAKSRGRWEREPMPWDVLLAVMGGVTLGLFLGLAPAGLL